MEFCFLQRDRLVMSIYMGVFEKGHLQRSLGYWRGIYRSFLHSISRRDLHMGSNARAAATSFYYQSSIAGQLGRLSFCNHDFSFAYAELLEYYA